MSLSLAALTASGPSDFGTFGQLIADNTLVKQRLDTLTAQASSGLVSGTLAGLGGAAASQSLDLNAEIGHLQTAQNNISAVTGALSVSQTAASQITGIATSFYSQLTSLSALDPQSVDTLAASARTALQQVAGLIDSTNGSTYVFAGQDSANPPVPNPNSITSSGFFTQISAAVSGLGTNGASATTASLIAIGGSNAAGTSPFSPALSQPAATVRALQTSVDIGHGQQVNYGLLASANTSPAIPTPFGVASTGSYMRDIMTSLAAIGSLSSSQAGASGFSPFVAAVQSTLDNAISAMGVDAGVQGNIQSALQSTATNLGATETALTAQVSSLQDVNMASTLSNLSLVQTQLQASYQLIAGMSGLTLAKYI